MEARLLNFCGATEMGGGDQSVNHFLKTLSEITAKKKTSKACFLMPDFCGGTSGLIFVLIAYVERDNTSKRLIFF